MTLNLITTIEKQVGTFKIYESEDERLIIEYNGKQCFGTLGGDKIFFNDMGAEFAIKNEKGLVHGLSVKNVNDLAKIKRFIAKRQAERNVKAGAEMVTCWECGHEVVRRRARWDGFGFYCGC